MSDNNPGAGGKGTAGYFGYSTDATINGHSEDEFERRYMQLIPQNVYKTRAHDYTTCKICTSKNSITFCPNFGLSFEPLPTEVLNLGNRRVTRCVYCKKAFRNDPIGKRPKRHSKAI